MPKQKFVFMLSEGNADLTNILGQKGANLAEMTNLSLPVPPGFTITCDACLKFFENPEFLDQLKPEIEVALRKLEKITGKKFGDKKNPLLVSIRSSSPISMPGMLDSILNVGLNEIILDNLKQTKNEWFVLDTYRRFIQMYNNIVIGIDQSEFNDIISEIKAQHQFRASGDSENQEIKEIIVKLKNKYKEVMEGDFPENPKEQLYNSIKAVFDSWERPRARYYRDINKIPNFGTAVIIQEMVYGNLNESSMTGVAFTRDPSTGEKNPIGEYLTISQGEAINLSNFTPKKLLEMKKVYPEIFQQLLRLMQRIEDHFKDMHYIEFTVENGVLYLLQTRVGKRTAMACVKIAIDMMEEGLISKEEAILLVEPSQLEHFLHKRIDNSYKIQKISEGINGSPGAVTGKIVFTSEDAEKWTGNGEKIILCRPQLEPDDIHGLIAADGILMVYGGKTSPAVVIARGLGKPVVCGAKDIFMDLEKKLFWVEDLNHIFNEGDVITIDGSTGIVAIGSPKLIEPTISLEFEKLLEIADEIRVLNVRANAETPFDLENAIKFGAEGIGLCRTENMFMAPERLSVVRKMIRARSSEERILLLNKLKPMQKEDFKAIFRIMNGKPVTIRLLDLPLYDFLPDIKDINAEVTLLRYRLERGEDVKRELKEKEEQLVITDSFFETNSMLGLRGCRLGILWPEINMMQVEAIIEAACELSDEKIIVLPEIMIPLIGFVAEFKIIKKKLTKLANKIIQEYNSNLVYKIGALIEVPRAALTIGEIALEADFFSFGTNDLTQMTLAFSQNDAEHKFLPKYMEKGILKENPFEVLDIKGTGKLIKMAVEEGRKVKPDLEYGICGEHGGDPKSIEFFHKIGLNYISCSSFRVPVARLASARAQLKFPRKKRTN